MALGRKIMIFLQESVYFCKAQVEAKQIVSMHCKQKHWFSCRKYTILVTEEGLLAAVGTQNIDFLAGKCIFLQGSSGGQTNRVDALEAKTLVFLQENVHFH